MFFAHFSTSHSCLAFPVYRATCTLALLAAVNRRGRKGGLSHAFILHTKKDGLSSLRASIHLEEVSVSNERGE